MTRLRKVMSPSIQGHVPVYARSCPRVCTVMPPRMHGHVPAYAWSCPQVCMVMSPGMPHLCKVMFPRSRPHKFKVKSMVVVCVRMCVWGGGGGTWKRTVAAWYQFQPLLTNGWPHTVRHCANPVPHTHTHTHTHTLVRTHHVRMRVWPRNVRHCANPAPHTHTCACVAPHRTSLREPCAAERGVGGEKKERGTE